MHTFVPFVDDKQIEVIGTGLLDHSLPKAMWTHAAHFSATLWLLLRHPELDLSIEMPQMIRSYNEAKGGANTDTNGYHETITQASIRAARAFLLAAPPLPLFESCNALMRSRLGERDWLLKYWSRDRLFSVQARRAWLDPDLKSLPFA
jgi:hypothetical protein